MATVIDITNKIKNEPAFIKVGDKSFEVDKSKNTVTACLAKLDELDGLEAMDYCLKEMLGGKAFKEVESMKLDFNSYKVVFIAVMACAMDLKYEDAESRFQQSATE